MRRRDFITVIGGAAAVWPLGALAQQSAKVPTVGFLGAGTPASHGLWIAACVQRLRELGWVEGRNITIEYRWAEGRTARVAEIAAEFVQLKVDVIVTSGSSAVKAAMQVTPEIPIIFAAAQDPVGDGLVASLARPGGNVTGFSAQLNALDGKRLQLLREMVPGLRNIAAMFNSANPSARSEAAELQAAARSLGMEVFALEIQRADDVAPAIGSLKGRVGALYVVADPLVGVTRIQINTLALAARLPVMHGIREFVVSGGLMSYGASFPDMFRRAGDYVDRILKGAKPADLPVQQPTAFELVINAGTAKALGLTVPLAILAQADEVIE